MINWRWRKRERVECRDISKSVCQIEASKHERKHCCVGRTRKPICDCTTSELWPLVNNHSPVNLMRCSSTIYIYIIGRKKRTVSEWVSYEDMFLQCLYVLSWLGSWVETKFNLAVCVKTLVAFRFGSDLSDSCKQDAFLYAIHSAYHPFFSNTQISPNTTPILHLQCSFFIINSIHLSIINYNKKHL